MPYVRVTFEHKPFPPLPPPEPAYTLQPLDRSRVQAPQDWWEIGLPRVLNYRWWLANGGEAWPQSLDKRHPELFDRRWYAFSRDNGPETPRWLAACIGLAALAWVWQVAAIAYTRFMD